MILVSCSLAISVAVNNVADVANERRATRDAQMLTNGGLAYALNPANKGNRYPQVLAELVKPPWGGASYLSNGEKGLVDPWGRLYECAYEANERGVPQFYVWTVRNVNGKVKVYGTKPPESKKP